MWIDFQNSRTNFCRKFFYVYTTEISTTLGIFCYTTLRKLKIEIGIVYNFDSIPNKLLTCS